MKSDEPDLQFKILMAEREHFSLGGNKRICYTLPPLVFQAYQLALIYSRKREQVGQTTISINDPVLFINYYSF